MMSIFSGRLGVLIPQWSHRDTPLLSFLHSRRMISLMPRLITCSTNKPTPKQNQMGYDPSEELLGLDVDLKPRNVRSDSRKPRSWFGPNGQYIRELPCPSCRGRGYTPCAECGIEGSISDCPQCCGKGIMTCHQCSGDCVIWEESIDEQPWEKARSISLLKVTEDDEVDNLDIKLDMKKKSKRVYQSPPPEVGLKISRSLKSLNAKTGIFSKRMKIIHGDPKLQAQRVAAIKKARSTGEARKRSSETMKAYFSDPENRLKRSIAMKGAKFYCSVCGREGHRKHYCAEFKNGSTDRRSRCRFCGEKGHNIRTCPKSKSRRCRICHENGHNRRTCPQVTRLKLGGGSEPSRNVQILGSSTHTCRLCGEQGHNSRTCSKKKTGFKVISSGDEEEANTAIHCLSVDS